jgi:hypothetical protein
MDLYNRAHLHVRDRLLVIVVAPRCHELALRDLMNKSLGY